MAAPPPSADSLGPVRSAALALALTPPLLLVYVLLDPADMRFPALVMPTSLGGLLAPVMAFRFYHHRRERLADGAGHERGAGEFRLATLASSSITALAAIAGVIGFWLSENAITLVGIAMHAVLCGAVWPTPERLERFTGPDGGHR